jgi:hypothetical protein
MISSGILTIKWKAVKEKNKAFLKSRVFRCFQEHHQQRKRITTVSLIFPLSSLKHFKNLKHSTKKIFPNYQTVKIERNAATPESVTT